MNREELATSKEIMLAHRRPSAKQLVGKNAGDVEKYHWIGIPLVAYYQFSAYGGEWLVFGVLRGIDGKSSCWCSYFFTVVQSLVSWASMSFGYPFLIWLLYNIRKVNPYDRILAVSTSTNQRGLVTTDTVARNFSFRVISRNIWS